MIQIFHFQSFINLKGPVEINAYKNQQLQWDAKVVKVIAGND